MCTSPRYSTSARARMMAEGFDPLEGRGGPVARARADSGPDCPLAPGIPPEANVTSVRNAPALFGLGLIDTIPDEVILAEAARQELGGSVRGRPHRLTDADGGARIGRPRGLTAQSIGSVASFSTRSTNDDLLCRMPLILYSRSRSRRS